MSKRAQRITEEVQDIELTPKAQKPSRKSLKKVINTLVEAHKENEAKIEDLLNHIHATDIR